MNLIPSSIRQKINNQPSLIKIINNIGWLLLDKIIQIGVGLFVGVWVARYLGPEKFGLFNFATVFISLFSAIAGLGLRSVVIRDIVRDPYAKGEILGSAAILQFIGSLVIYALSLLVISWMRPDNLLVLTLVAILGLTILLTASEVALYWFESQVQSKYVIWVKNSCLLIFASIKALLIIKGASIKLFAWVFTAEMLLASIAMLIVLQIRGLKIKEFNFNAVRAKRLMKDSWPLLLSGLAVTLAMRIDQIMIGEILSSTILGFYSVAVRMAELFVFFGMIISSSFFPRLIDLDDEAFEKEYVKLIRIPFYFLVVLALIVSVTSKFSVDFVFGVEYGNSAPLLSILIFSIPITYVSMMSSQYLLRKGENKEILFRQFSGLIVNIVLNLILISRFGALGAAVATIITDLVISVGMDFKRKKFKCLLRLKIHALLFVEG